MDELFSLLALAVGVLVVVVALARVVVLIEHAAERHALSAVRLRNERVVATLELEECAAQADARPLADESEPAAPAARR